MTLEQLGERLGRRRAYELVRSLTKKQVLTRIGRGLYSVRPFRAHDRPWMISAPVAAAHLLAAELYYLGGRWASWLHKLIAHRCFCDPLAGGASGRTPSRQLLNMQLKNRNGLLLGGGRVGPTKEDDNHMRREDIEAPPHA